METVVLLNLQERRMCVGLAGVIDDALDLAEECGWRYAIAYLISERVPSPIIQRLLSGNGRVRRTAETSREESPSWHGSNADEMNRLFDWLQQRRSGQTCRQNGTPLASRASEQYDEIC